MKIVGVIPVRAGSSRFPGKGLAKLGGREVVLHTFSRAQQYRRFLKLVVATDDLAIKRLIEDHGGEVFFSEQPYRNGSERAAAAIAGVGCDICVNVQGDEVFVTPEALEQIVAVLESGDRFAVATAGYPIPCYESPRDRNLVKVLVAADGEAKAFSRQEIGSEDGRVLGHVGIYAYRRDTLVRYANLPPSRSETEESLEQLRLLNNDIKIGVAQLAAPLLSINTPEDLLRAEQILAAEGGVRS